VITTEAWVLHSGKGAALETGAFRLEPYSFPDPGDDEVLVEPLFGSWEGNMSHALVRKPIDVCLARGEEKVVLGNSGVVRVLKPGAAVRTVKEGDVCLFVTRDNDKHGYMLRAFAYDQPNTVGMLAKRSKIYGDCLLPIPRNTPYTYAQWAAYSLRYLTAWSNWKVAYGAYRLQISSYDDPTPHVWGWGGGTTFAELTLAQRAGCRVAMTAGSDARLQWLEKHGIHPVDRRTFPDLELTDEKRYATDADYKAAYDRSEAAFLKVVKEVTGGQGAAIFCDYIGSPVARATLKALAREGVLTTAGWKLGMNIPVNRAVECLKRHIHVFTHFGRYQEGREAMEYAAQTGWMPPIRDERPFDFEEVSQLARAAADGTLGSYFPVFRVNPL
jgi:NADPH:quinone reductase-like Zn-dependent oxidoreductase